MLINEDRNQINQVLNPLLMTEEQIAIFKLLSLEKKTWNILEKNNIKLAQKFKNTLE